MKRRRYLATLGLAAGGGLAGCLGSSDPVETGGDGTGPTTGRDGNPRDICSKSARPAVIPAILEPSFAPDYSDISASRALQGATPVVGIERDGTARAYPVPLLARYEIVNDRFDVPVLVTYCPLCSSGLTATREVDGEETVFGNTSRTWQAPNVAGRDALEEGRVFGAPYRTGRGSVAATNDQNLVLFDESTGSYWSQLLAQAICGPLTGTRLTLIPSTVTTWREWRAAHPGTTVLLPPPHSST